MVSWCNKIAARFNPMSIKKYLSVEGIARYFKAFLDVNKIHKGLSIFLKACQNLALNKSEQNQ